MKHIIKAYTKKSNNEIDIEITIKSGELVDIRSLSNIDKFDYIETLKLPFLYSSQSGKIEKVFNIGSNVFHSHSTLKRGVKIASDGNYIETLILPEGIVYICDNAFEDTEIKNIVWPSTCKTISKECFCNSTIKTISGIENVKDIQKSAFERCTQLKTINWPQNTKTIPSRCFLNCTHLESVEGIGNISNIGECAFYNCKSIESFNWPTSCSVIPTMCFFDCYSLKNVNIYAPINRIEECAFQGTKIKSLDLSNSIFCSIQDVTVQSIAKKLPFYQNS